MGSYLHKQGVCTFLAVWIRPYSVLIFFVNKLDTYHKDSIIDYDIGFCI